MQHQEGRNVESEDSREEVVEGWEGRSGCSALLGSSWAAAGSGTTCKTYYASLENQHVTFCSFSVDGHFSI